MISLHASRSIPWILIAFAAQAYPAWGGPSPEETQPSPSPTSTISVDGQTAQPPSKAEIPEIHSEIQVQINQGTNAIDGARKQLEKVETETSEALKAESASDPILEEIQDGQASIERNLIAVETEQIAFLENLKSHRKELESLRAVLRTKIRGFDRNSSESVMNAYTVAVETWRDSAEVLFSLFDGIETDIRIELPELLVLQPEEKAAQSAYSSYLEKFKELKERYRELNGKRIRLANELKAFNFQLLRESGELRANLLNACDRIACPRQRGLNEENIQDLGREIKLVPLKIVSGGLNKWLEVRAKFSSGVDGWISLGRQLFFLLALLLIPLILVRTLRWTSRKLDTLRKDLLARSMLDYRRRTSLAMWISRLNPFLPSAGMAIATHAARGLIENTDLSEASRVLYYVEIYFIYKILRQGLAITLELLFASRSIDKLKDQQEEIEKSAARISRLVFIEYVLLHITEDTVREAFAYQILSGLIFWINIGFLYYESVQWKAEILEAFTERFPRVADRMSRTLPNSGIIATLPFLLGLVILHDLAQFVGSYLIRIDAVKRVLSEVLRKKLERVERSVSSSCKPDAGYLAEFDYYLPAHENIFVDRPGSTIHLVFPEIESWRTGRSSNDLALIVGNRGMGKSTILQNLHRKCEAVNGHSLFVRIPARILDQAQLFEWLSDALGTPVRNAEDILAWDTSLQEKTVILVDDLQNLFLGEIGGFEAYRAFLRVISLKTRNLFWCLTINSRSWAYIRGVLGQEHFYGTEFRLQAWKDSEIQRLILLRHDKAGHKRIFDDSIKAYGTGDALGQQAESQFFRLLWGQSRGNPRSAMMYWISAITQPEPGLVHVGIPEFVNSGLVASMSDDALFLLAAIARYENLTQTELQRTTQIPDTVVKKCLKEAQDKNLIWVDEAGRFRISSRAQYVIDYFLIGKNFLYE